MRGTYVSDSQKEPQDGCCDRQYPGAGTPPIAAPPDADPKAALFHRSLGIREVDTGSCNACAMEMNALTNSVYDVERLGIQIAASPRHADALVITGPVTVNMRRALKDVYDATPDPKLVIATVPSRAASSKGAMRSSAIEGDEGDPPLPHLPADLPEIDVELRGREYTTSSSETWS